MMWMQLPGQKKKPERISWAPEFVATRASSRTLSLQNRSETLRRLEESEKRRLHTIALMEKAAAKKDSTRVKKREMTQEERLAEAKITERRNRKSLCSWEETERAKIEEQRQRLLALQNRKLAGPVITYWSGRAEWNADGKLLKVGKKMVEVIEDDKKIMKKGRIRCKDREIADNKHNIPPPTESASGSASMSGSVSGPASEPVSGLTLGSTLLAVSIPEADSRHNTAFVKPPPLPSPIPVLDQNNKAPMPNGVSNSADPSLQTSPQQDQSATAAKSPISALPPKPIDPSARNIIILENFEPHTVRDRASLVKTLWGDQHRRIPTTKPYCSVTHQPAKFRDPATGMPFASLHAYRELRRLLRGEIQWSYLLDAYVGEANMTPAMGVPEGF